MTVRHAKGCSTGASNAAFDAYLAGGKPVLGACATSARKIALDQVGRDAVRTAPMPANNWLWVFARAFGNNGRYQYEDGSMPSEPIRYIAHLGHVEVLTPKIRGKPQSSST